MNNCLFCRIAKGEIPSEIIYEDNKTLSFLDVNPKAPGHTLVIPKTHSENILDLPEADCGDFFLTVKRTAQKLNDSLKPHGFTIGINHGRKAGQLVDHLHVHIIPRFEDDKGGSIHTVVNNPGKWSVKETANKIRANSQ